MVGYLDPQMGMMGIGAQPSPMGPISPLMALLGQRSQMANPYGAMQGGGQAAGGRQQAIPQMMGAGGMFGGQGGGQVVGGRPQAIPPMMGAGGSFGGQGGGLMGVRNMMGGPQGAPMEMPQVPQGGLMGVANMPGVQGGGGLMGLLGDPKWQLAMMGAGSAMSQAAGPSPYKQGFGGALGAGMGGLASGLMGAQQMQRDEEDRQQMRALMMSLLGRGQGVG